MNRILKFSAALAAVIAALYLMAFSASAASFEITQNDIDIIAGQSVDIPVNTSVRLKVHSQCASVAKGEFNSGKSTVTVTAKNFGTVLLTVSNASDSSDKAYILVNVSAPSVSGKFINLTNGHDQTEVYKRFRCSDGSYAKGWNRINGDTYYFYPNGVLEAYNGPVMSKNRLYFLDHGRYTGEIFEAYIFEVINNNMPVAEDCEDFYNDCCARYGKNKVKKELTKDGGIAVTAPSYMPGFPWGAKGTYYFYNDDSTASGDLDDMFGYTFGSRVTYSLSGHDDVMYKSTLKSLYVRKALFEAFGTNCKSVKTKDGSKLYRWKNVGAEKATVEAKLGSGSVDFDIYA